MGEISGLAGEGAYGECVSLRKARPLDRLPSQSLVKISYMSGKTRV